MFLLESRLSFAFSRCTDSMGSASSSVNFALLNQSINRYVPIPLLFFGIIGNVLNILVFTRRTFRNNICVAYFLASTIFDSFAIIIGLLPRLLNGFGADPSQSSALLCKIRFFITYFTGYTAAWFISLACVERYLSSSINVHRRQLITMKRAYLSMVIVILMGFVLFGEQFYCIDINQQLFGAPQSCYQLKQNIRCQIVDSLMQFIFEMFMPALMMTGFGLLTLKNVRQKRRGVHTVQAAESSIPVAAMIVDTFPSTHQQPTNVPLGQNKQSVSTTVNRTAQKRDIQLFTMLLVQVSSGEEPKRSNYFSRSLSSLFRHLPLASIKFTLSQRSMRRNLLYVNQLKIQYSI